MAERVITVEMNVDATGAVAGIEKTTNSLESMEAQLSEINEDLKKVDVGGKLFKALKQEAEALTSQIESATSATKNLSEEIATVEDELRNLSKNEAAEQSVKSFNRLNKIVDENVLSIQELGAAADNYKNIALAAGTSSPIGQEALKRAAEMEKQMDKVNVEVTQLAEGGRALNATMQIGTGVIAGYTAFQGVTALLGEENEELQKTFVKLQAAQSTLMGLKELSIALDKQGIIVTTAQGVATKAMAAIQLAYSAAVGTSTGALKLFRLALIGTGIGAIVVGLGLLIANFDLVKKSVMGAIDQLANLSNVILFLLGPIGLLIIAYKLLFKTVEDEETAAEKQQRQRMEAENKRHKEKLKNIEDEKNARIEAADETIDATKRQIEINENLGKSTTALTIQVLEAEAEKKRAILDANAEILQASIDHFRNMARS